MDEDEIGEYWPFDPSILPSLKVGNDELSHSLSSVEIKTLMNTILKCDNFPVVAYSDIFNKETAKEYDYIRKFLSQTEIRAAIFLFRQTETYGHWMALFENSDGDLYVYDSYGDKKPDEYIIGEDGIRNKTLNQESPYLLDCFGNSSYEYIHWNDYPQQKLKPNIQTCGKWSIFRILNRDMDVEDFADFIKDICKKYKLPTDNYVCLAYRFLCHHYHLAYEQMDLVYT
jgi:hypothetical protein